MPTPIHTPRINNNDDTVKLAKIFVEIGAAVRRGDPIADVETDKATFTVESSEDGFLLSVNGQVEDILAVGSVLAWIGATPDEKAPESAACEPDGASGGEPTLKALLLLREYGLRASEIPASGERLMANDVERYARSLGRTRVGDGSGTAALGPKSDWPAPEEPGRVQPFTAEERAMARTVTWHRDVAAAGYVELAYDPGAWDAYAAEFQKAHGLMMSPLLGLMTWKLAQLAAENPRINATAAAGGVLVYDHVNLGFTVQAGSQLYLVVVRDAAGMSELEFVRGLGELQRAAMKHNLKPENAAGATIAFSSMARWKIVRHQPLLPPHTALMVAHAAPMGSTAFLGAAYDHRILTGFDAARALQALAAPRAGSGK